MPDTTSNHPAGSPNASVVANPEAAALDTAYRLARRRVRMLRGWYTHALIYACVIGGLWAIYTFSGHPARFTWPLPPTLGWGLGLAIHGIFVWLATSPRGRQWESRKIEQYMQEEIASRGNARR